MASFPQASPPTPCAHLYPPPYAPHALPISFVLYCLSVGKLIISYINIFSFINIFVLFFGTCFSQSSIFYESYYLCQQIKTVIALKNVTKLIIIWIAHRINTEVNFLQHISLHTRRAFSMFTCQMSYVCPTLRNMCYAMQR